MKVLVIGANGKIGHHLVDLLQHSNEHKPRAMVRKKDQADALKEAGVETVIADLEDSVDSIAESAKECDAIVFTAGSGGKTGPDKTLLVDLDGAVKSIEAAEKAGIERFIMISALQAHLRENWNEKIRPYYVAKHYADRMLRASSLNYTIIRPGGLLDEPGTGKVEAAENVQRSTIPRQDVAHTAMIALNEKNTFRKSFDLVSGDTLIEVALKEV